MRNSLPLRQPVKPAPSQEDITTINRTIPWGMGSPSCPIRPDVVENHMREVMTFSERSEHLPRQGLRPLDAASNVMTEAKHGHRACTRIAHGASATSVSKAKLAKRRRVLRHCDDRHWGICKSLGCHKIGKVKRLAKMLFAGCSTKSMGTELVLIEGADGPRQLPHCSWSQRSFRHILLEAFQARSNGARRYDLAGSGWPRTCTLPRASEGRLYITYTHTVYDML